MAAPPCCRWLSWNSKSESTICAERGKGFFPVFLSSFVFISPHFYGYFGCKLSFKAFSKIFGTHVFIDIQTSENQPSLRPYTRRRAKLVPKSICVPELYHVPAMRPQPLAETENWKPLIKMYCKKNVSKCFLSILTENSTVSEYNYSTVYPFLHFVSGLKLYWYWQ